MMSQTKGGIIIIVSPARDLGGLGALVGTSDDIKESPADDGIGVGGFAPHAMRRSSMYAGWDGSSGYGPQMMRTCMDGGLGYVETQILPIKRSAPFDGGLVAGKKVSPMAYIQIVSPEEFIPYTKTGQAQLN